MEHKLFIPKKIRVGYVKRQDTYTQRLAYVIYYDEKGKLRKETSWEKWRDKSIDPEEFENKPHSGFVINKDVQRSNDWFGSGRNMIRVYDDRGIEFEITCDNLIHILMDSNCIKRGLEGEYVYAWQGKELVLLPVNSQEYQIAFKYTELKSQKIKSKELIAGCSYKTKELENLIYLGKFDYYTFKYRDGKYSGPKIRNSKSMFVFIDSNKNLKPLLNINSLAFQNTHIPITDYAEYMQVFSDSEFSSPITELISKSDFEKMNEFINQYEIGKNYENTQRKVNCVQSFFLKKDENIFFKIDIFPEFKYSNDSTRLYEFIGFKVIYGCVVSNINNELQIQNHYYGKEVSGASIKLSRYAWSTKQENFFNHEDLKKFNIVSLFIMFSNGKKVSINKYI